MDAKSLVPGCQTRCETIVMHNSLWRLVFVLFSVMVNSVADPSVTEDALQASGTACRVADLFLHSPADADGNALPVAVVKSPNVPNLFLATLDYSMTGFDVEARAVPEDRCKMDQMVQTTTMVDPGSSVPVQLLVRDTSLPKSDTNPRAYKLQVTRLRGTETSLRALKIDHGILVPAFAPSSLNYTSYLDVTQDIVKFIFQRLDNGQVVGLASSLEEPLDNGRRLQSSGDPLGPPIGEVQYLPSTLTSTIDVGRQRKIDVVVESADRSAVGRYTFTVQRPFCPEERRFFDGAAKACTDVCNEGSFGNPSTGRCSICLQRHCAVCDRQNQCTSCIDGYGLQGNSCVLGASDNQMGLIQPLTKLTTKVERYSSRHVLVMVAASTVGTAALCSCLFIVLSGNLGSRCQNVRRGHRGRSFDSDDEYSMRSSEFDYS